MALDVERVEGIDVDAQVGLFRDGEDLEERHVGAPVPGAKEEGVRERIETGWTGRITHGLNTPVIQQPVVLVTGNNNKWTGRHQFEWHGAAGEFIVSSDALTKLAKASPTGSLNGNFEAVLKVEVVDGETGAATVVASQFW